MEWDEYKKTYMKKVMDGDKDMSWDEFLIMAGHAKGFYEGLDKGRARGKKEGRKEALTEMSNAFERVINLVGSDDRIIGVPQQVWKEAMWDAYAALRKLKKELSEEESEE